MKHIIYLFLAFTSLNINAQISINGTATPAGAYGTDFFLTETFDGSGFWYGTFDLNVGEFKIRKDESWSPVHWTAGNNNPVYPIGIASTNSLAIQIPIADSYQITFNEATAKTTIISNISIIGTATPAHNWTTDFDMTPNFSQPLWWSTEILLTSDPGMDKFKFRVNHNWDVSFGGLTFPTGNNILNGPDIPVNYSNNFIAVFNLEFDQYYFEPEIPCNNPVSNSTSSFFAQCGSNTLSTSIIPGQYITVTNLQDFSFLQINSSILGDYFTLRKASDNSVITHSNFIDIIYEPSMGDIEIHLNTDDQCGWGGDPRTLTLSESCPCNNTQSSSTTAYPIECGYNTASTNAMVGEYFITTDYTPQLYYTYISSDPTDYITLRKTSDNSVVAFGQVPVELFYESGMGDIKVHLNDQFGCASTSTMPRTIDIAEVCYCDNQNAYSASPVDVNLICGGNTTYEVALSYGQYITTTGYSDATTLVFSSQNDYITVRRADNNTLLAVGQSPIQFNYESSYGDLEVHLNEDFSCTSNSNQGNLTIEMKCGCDNILSTSIANLECGDNLIDPFYPSGYYTTIANYLEGSILQFSSTVPTDYFTLRNSSDNSIIASGITPLVVYTNEFNGFGTEMHVNSNELCGTEGSDRSVRIFQSCPCQNTVQYPLTPINVKCGTNVIATDQQAGQFNITTGYPEGSKCIFTSSGNYDFISLYTFDDILLEYGPSPLTLDYYSATYGDLKMHISSNGECGISTNERTTQVTVTNCPCINPVQNPVTEYTNLKCGENIITTEITSGQFCKVSQNFPSGYLVTFYSSISSDILSVKVDGTTRYYGVGEITIGFNGLPNFEVHINEDSTCSTNTIARTLSAYINCICENTTSINNQPISVNCGNNVLFNAMHPGEYLSTQGYPANSAAIFSSSNPNDFITIIDASSNSAVANGYSPLKVFITSENQLLEMHLNTSVGCGSSTTPSMTSVKVLCNCYNVSEFAGALNPCVSGEIELLSQGYFYLTLNNDLDLTINSSKPSDYFHVYRNDNLESVYSGPSPGSFTYTPSMGILFISVYPDANCGDDGLFRNISVSYSGNCPDQDMDFVSDYNDNCISIPNSNQADLDGDGIGDVCDEDIISNSERIGLGTTNPKAKLHVKDGNIFLDKNNAGIILRADNGDCYIAKPTEVENPSTGEFSMELKLFKIDCPSNGN